MAQRIIDRTYVGEVLQHIYSSDLHSKVTLFFEGGYFYMGIEQKRFALPGTTIEEAVTSVALQLATKFPTSPFTKWWNETLREDDDDYR